MKTLYRNSDKVVEYKPSLSLRFLYNTILGRLILKLFTSKFFANLGAKYMNSSLSKKRADKFVKEYKINLDLYEENTYSCYNDIFKRKFKNIRFSNNPKDFISPCESNLLVSKINKDSIFKIKNSVYNLKDIINDDVINNYIDGYALIFRLCVDNYHHYIYPDKGYRDDYKEIDGILHTVQPIAYERYNVYHKNYRTWTTLHTDNFGDVIMVEVGALLIGKVVNNNQKVFIKGEEKGHFEFGGSTIILFVKGDNVSIDEDILNNSKNGCETFVHIGETIGHKNN